MSKILKSIDISSLISFNVDEKSTIKDISFNDDEKSTIKDNERIIIEVRKEHIDDPKEKGDHNISKFLNEDNIEKTTNVLKFHLKHKGYIFDTDVLGDNKYNKAFDYKNKEEFGYKNLYSRIIQNDIMIPVDVVNQNTMLNYIENSLSKKLGETEVLIEENIKFNGHHIYPNNYFSIKLDVQFGAIDVYDLCWLKFKEDLINSGDVVINGWEALGQLYKDNIKRFEPKQIFQVMRNDEEIKLDNFIRAREEVIKRIL